MLVSCLHQTFQSCVLLNWFESLSIIQFKCGFFFSLDTMHTALRNDFLSLRKAAQTLEMKGLGFPLTGLVKVLATPWSPCSSGFPSQMGRGTSVLSVSQRLSPRSKGQIANTVHGRGRLGGRVCPLVGEDLQRAIGTWNAGRRAADGLAGEQGHSLFLFCQDQFSLRKQPTWVTLHVLRPCSHTAVYCEEINI